MTLQREVKRDQWVDYQVDGETVKSPVDIEKLPAGKYRLAFKEPPVIDPSGADIHMSLSDVFRTDVYMFSFASKLS